jgi:hypothetical protein
VRIHHVFFASAAILIEITAVAFADPKSPGPQIAALPPGNGAATVTSPPAIANLSSASIPREAPSGVGDRQFRVWPGYDSDVALDPYTNNLSPCPEGALGSGCSPTHGQIIPPSRYERTLFMD